jgi:type I restriction enzyme S subunit
VPLPKGWAATKLGQIRVDLSRTLDPRQYPDERFELYSVPSFADGEPEIVRGSAIGSAKMTLTPGTVVVCKINPRINRVWVVGDRSPHKKIGSGEWIPFFPIDGVTPHFLASYLQRDHFRNFLAARASGVGGSLMRVRPTTLDEYPLPIPSVSEQQRIVEAIETYLTRLDNAVALLERVEENLKRYRASVLKAAVEGRLVPTEAELARHEGRSYEHASELLKRILAERRTRWIGDAAEKARAKAEERARVAGKPSSAEDSTATLERERAKAAKQYKEPPAPDATDLPDLSEGWCWATAGQVLDTLEGGNSASAQDEETERPVLRSSAVRQSCIDFTDHRFLRADAPVKADPYLCKGDLLFTRLSGSIAYVGNCAIVPDVGFQQYEYPDRLFRGRVLGAVDGQYFHHCFATPALRRQIEQTVKSAAGHQRIGLDDLRRYAFPLPPAGEQQRIAQATERALASGRAVFLDVAKQRRRAMQLRQSILKWAFEGKLVEQDSNDEPASLLLKRIEDERRAERGATQ